MGFIKKLTTCIRNTKKKSRRPSLAIGLLVTTAISATVATHHVPSTVFNGFTREDHTKDDVKAHVHGNVTGDLPGESNHLRDAATSVHTPGASPAPRDHEHLLSHALGLSVVGQHLRPNGPESAIVVPVQGIPSVPNHGISSLGCPLHDLIGVGKLAHPRHGIVPLPDETIETTTKPGPLPIHEDGSSEDDEFFTPTGTPEPDDADSILARWENVAPLHFGRHTFTITCQIGQGSFGFIWQAFDENKAEVAIKVLHKRKLFVQTIVQHPDARLVNWACARTVTNEINALVRATGSGCPFLTPLLCSFADDDNIYLVMRMYSTNLRDFVKRRGNLYPRRMSGLNLYLTRLWAAEILLGVQAMHKAGIMHRDLKLENILITPAGHVAIADFGLAALAQDGQPSQVQYDCCGTPGHFAPEQHPHRCLNGYDHRVDIYAYGLILLEMFLGSPWYAIIENYDPNRCSPYDPRIQDVIALVRNADARLLISRLLSPDPQCRPDPEQIKQFSFFADLDWDTVSQRLYTPHVTPCASKTASRNATSGIYSFHRTCSSVARNCAQDLIDHSARENEGLGALNVDFLSDDELWSDPFHGVTCTWPKPRLVCEPGEGGTQGTQRRCRYYPLREVYIHNHL
ncbi:kinase-like domain-containing protein [Phlebopus sp. FC_14]|nr:kinase-like domain-containing protein [Phlebopus sp. FC_14]